MKILNHKTMEAFFAESDEQVTALLYTDRTPTLHEQDELEGLGCSFRNKKGISSLNLVSIPEGVFNTVLALGYVEKIERLS